MIPLHFSPVASIHGPQPCSECGGPTNYWFAPMKLHLCPSCAFDIEDEDDRE